METFAQSSPPFVSLLLLYNSYPDDYVMISVRAQLKGEPDWRKTKDLLQYSLFLFGAWIWINAQQWNCKSRACIISKKWSPHESNNIQYALVPWSKRWAALKTVPSPPTAITRSTSLRCCLSKSSRLTHEKWILLRFNISVRSLTHSWWALWRDSSRFHLSALGASPRTRSY